MKWVLPCVAFFWGLPVAIAFGKYMIEVAGKRPIRAAFWDFSIMVMGMSVTVAWLESGNHLVLFTYAAGNAVGTYLVTKYGHTK